MRVVIDLLRNLKIFILVVILFIFRFDSDGMNYGYGKVFDLFVFVLGFILRLRLEFVRMLG